MLILKRASKSRPSGEWSDDDYDVFDFRASGATATEIHSEPSALIADGKAAFLHLFF